MGTVLGSIVALTATEVQAQPVLRGLRFVRATVSPTFDVQGVETAGPPAGPVVAAAATAGMPAGPAEIRVMTQDPGTRIRINGQDIAANGVFNTPPLEAGWAYTYHITAESGQGGPRHETRVAVIAGERQLVDFRMHGGQPNRPDAQPREPQKTPLPPR